MILNMTKEERTYCLGLFNLLRSNLKQKIEFPALVEIQTINRCNASCPMCPYPKTIGKQPLTSMSEDLYDKLLGQLKNEPEFQVLVFSFQNEPFLDKNIIKRAKKFKSLLPEKQLQVVTNGNLLTPELIPEVYQYFDLVSISINAATEETYKIVTGNLDWKSTQNNLKTIANKKEWIDKTILRFIRQKTNEQETKIFKKYWNEKGFRVFGFETNSRLGETNNYEAIKIAKKLGGILQIKFLKAISKFFISSCPIPFLSFYIRANGDVILCFNDYTEKNIYGNVNETKIRDIFNSKKYDSARFHSVNDHLPDFNICQKCDLLKEGIWLTI